jgi:hypothetical protein
MCYLLKAKHSAILEVMCLFLEIYGERLLL